ncbi:hypothetical protein SAMD00019534_084040 [Acytostelium subglobosum LB1]|uniref:hypothetical protein n=1 Tax=Acytostelium subglobosum LB1 TaxID=1410327 RepID=UPI000644AB09|nr:hypothetical protein SAMD00019534_084040 [Acytostelium subglobosum LB1]GAM25229.1 hypothetical protein SAMD00019534_084040 [Acytostelium subglobosum LB1]|eukprot:XP_012751749.1 hypothetical protein SAMD00019534_084040 [Acytostelium subglobosum LB1]
MDTIAMTTDSPAAGLHLVDRKSPPPPPEVTPTMRKDTPVPSLVEEVATATAATEEVVDVPPSPPSSVQQHEKPVMEKTTTEQLNGGVHHINGNGNGNGNGYGNGNGHTSDIVHKVDDVDHMNFMECKEKQQIQQQQQQQQQQESTTDTVMTEQQLEKDDVGAATNDIEDNDVAAADDEKEPTGTVNTPQLLSSSSSLALGTLQNETEFSFSFHVGPKIKAEKKKKDQSLREYHGRGPSAALSFPTSMVSGGPGSISGSGANIKKSKANGTKSSHTKPTHTPKTVSLSSRRAEHRPLFNGGDIGGSELFSSLFSGKTSCSKILKDCYRVSSSLSLDQQQLGATQDSDLLPLDQLSAHGNDESLDDMADDQLSTLTYQQQQQLVLLKSSSGMSIESIIQEEEESSSDEEKSYVKSLKERKALEDAEKGYNRVLREKIEQANVNRMFFEPNRKKVLTKEQQLHQDFLEQDIYNPPHLKSSSSETAAAEEVAAGKKRTAEDVIKEGVVTPKCIKVTPYVPYNINISRRFLQDFKQGYIVYNQQRDLISSPPLTPVGPTTTVNGVNLSAVHMPAYIWRKVSEMFHNLNWSPEETALFEELLYIYGNDWPEISRLMCGSKAPLQIYRHFSKHQQVDHLDEEFVEDWRNICFICFISNSLKSRGKFKMNKSKSLVSCLSCDRVFHIGCLDPPLPEVPKGDWFCSSDCSQVSQIKCEACNKDDKEDSFVLCDTCNNGYHIYCVSPPLTEVPDEKWECQRCTGLANIKKEKLDHMLLDDVSKLERVDSNNNNNNDSSNNNNVINTPTKDHTASPMFPKMSALMTPPPRSPLVQSMSPSPSVLKRSVPQSPYLLSSSGTHTGSHPHPPLSLPHSDSCPNQHHDLGASMTSPNLTSTTTPDSSLQEQYTSAYARILSKEGHKIAAMAQPKPFYTLKKLSQICLGCLTQVGLLEESPHLTDLPEIYMYEELLRGKLLNEEEIESEGYASRQFDGMLSAIPIAVTGLIAQPVLSTPQQQQQQQPNTVVTPRRRTTLISSLLTTPPPSQATTSAFDATVSSTPYTTGSSKKRTRKQQKESSTGSNSDVASPIPMAESFQSIGVATTSPDSSSTHLHFNNNNASLNGHEDSAVTSSNRAALEDFLSDEASHSNTNTNTNTLPRADITSNSNSKKRRSTINETIGIARGRRSRLADGSSNVARWWIFSGNPKNKPELNDMKVGDQMEWVVRQHADNIRKSDFVYIWVCGKYAGIAATGITMCDPIRMDTESLSYSHTTKPNQHHTIKVQITSMLRELLPKRLIHDHDLLSKMTIIRAPLATNFWVTDEEADALASIVRSVNDGTLVIPPETPTTPVPKKNRSPLSACQSPLSAHSSDPLGLMPSTPISSMTSLYHSATSSLLSPSTPNTTPADLPSGPINSACTSSSLISPCDTAMTTSTTSSQPPTAPLPLIPSFGKKSKPLQPSTTIVSTTTTTTTTNQPIATTPSHSCTICKESTSPMIDCDSCGSFYHSTCLTDPINKANYAYWICFKCCMTDQDILNCKLVIGWLELRSKCKSIIVQKCEAFCQSHKRSKCDD